MFMDSSVKSDGINSENPRNWEIASCNKEPHNIKLVVQIWYTWRGQCLWIFIGHYQKYAHNQFHATHHRVSYTQSENIKCRKYRDGICLSMGTSDFFIRDIITNIHAKCESLLLSKMVPICLSLAICKYQNYFPNSELFKYVKFNFIKWVVEHQINLPFECHLRVTGSFESIWWTD